MSLSTVFQLCRVSLIGGGKRRKHRPVVSHILTLSHNVVSSTPRHERGSIRTHNFSDDRH